MTTKLKTSRARGKVRRVRGGRKKGGGGANRRVAEKDEVISPPEGVRDAFVGEDSDDCISWATKKAAGTRAAKTRAVVYVDASDPVYLDHHAHEVLVFRSYG